MLQGSRIRPLRATVAFCRFARAHGISCGVKETLDSLQAARAVGVLDREAFKLALRAVLCSSKQDWDRFDELFEAFWCEGKGLAPPSGDRRARVSWPPGLLESSPLFGSGKSLSDQEGMDNAKLVTGATALERLRRVDFSEISQNDLPELEQAAMRLLRRMALRLSRRLLTIKPRGRVDLRRTIRRSISHGGDPVNLSRKARKLERARLVVLVDVSGSMNAYSLFLVRFAYALQKHIRRVNTFVFSTRLEEITLLLRARTLAEALAALSRESAGWSAGTWSSGTKIGESLGNFNRRFAARLLSRDTLVMIMSDGWDTGEPDRLARELSTIHRRGRQVVWLNPLLGMEGYEPLTRGMAAALPFIDVFAPSHNLESLLALEHSLGVVRKGQQRPRVSRGLR